MTQSPSLNPAQISAFCKKKKKENIILISKTNSHFVLMVLRFTHTNIWFKVRRVWLKIPVAVAMIADGDRVRLPVKNNSLKVCFVLS